MITSRFILLSILSILASNAHANRIIYANVFPQDMLRFSISNPEGPDQEVTVTITSTGANKLKKLSATHWGSANVDCPTEYRCVKTNGPNAPKVKIMTGQTLSMGVGIDPTTDDTSGVIIKIEVDGDRGFLVAHGESLRNGTYGWFSYSLNINGGRPF